MHEKREIEIQGQGERDTATKGVRDTGTKGERDKKSGTRGHKRRERDTGS